MVTKTPLIAILALLGVFLWTAQSVAATTLSKSDEDFLTEMPLDDFPNAEEMKDRDNDGIVDSEQRGGKNDTSKNGGLVIPGMEDEKPKVKYVYKPGSSTELRRSIQDDRIEDGYVQDLMRQRGPR